MPDPVELRHHIHSHMKQSSLLAFAVVGNQVEETREARQKQQRAREDRKKAALELLGLPWPEPTRKGAGRPTCKEQYNAALHRAVQSDAPYFDRLSKEMPVVWRPGQPLVQEETMENQLAEIQESAASAQVKEEQTAEVKEEQEAGVGSPPQAKRVCRRLPEEAKAFALEYIALQQGRKKWSRARALEHLKALQPDLYGHLHPDTIKNWKPAAASPPGANPKVSAGACLRLCELFQSIVQQVPMSCTVFQSVANRELEQMGVAVHVSATWVRRTLKSLNMTYKSTTPLAKIVPKEAQAAAQQALKRKLTWLRDEKGISPERVLNMDQTAVLLLPTWQKSWLPKGSPCTVVKDEKTMITCCLAMTPVLGQLCAQFIYHGKTARVHPQGPCGPGWTCTHSPNHWSNFDTMKELLVQLDEFMCGSPSSKEPWVLLLDFCPIHISVGFRTFVKGGIPTRAALLRGSWHHWLLSAARHCCHAPLQAQAPPAHQPATFAADSFSGGPRHEDGAQQGDSAPICDELG